MGALYTKENKWTKNIVKDENAPELYSERAISFLSILFGVFFGSILLCMNLRKLETKKEVFWVASFGIIYTILQIGLLSLIPRNMLYTYLLNTVGASILISNYWRTYIGVNQQYRERSIWTPLMLGILLTITILLFSFLGNIDN
jgi:hypothetical protein